LQYEKHDNPRISTFRGIEIDSSDDSPNAFDSIRFNREFDSNEIDESDLHSLKLFADNVVIESGIHHFLTSNISAPAMNNVSTEPSFTVFRRIKKSLI
jgi:hypothetical protein